MRPAGVSSGTPGAGRKRDVIVTGRVEKKRQSFLTTKVAPLYHSDRNAMLGTITSSVGEAVTLRGSHEAVVSIESKIPPPARHAKG